MQLRLRIMLASRALPTTTTSAPPTMNTCKMLFTRTRKLLVLVFHEEGLIYMVLECVEYLN